MMNEVIKALMERRSIRRYKSEPLDEQSLEAILRAATFAPSSRNIQPWHITAIINPAKIEELNRAAKIAVTKEGFGQYREMVGQSGYSLNFGSAPVFIIVSVDPAASTCPQEDGALALGNILLAAHSLGYGGCWVNQLKFIAEENDFRRLLSSLGVPEGHKLIGCAALGRPDGDRPKAPTRKNDLITIVK